VTLQILVTIRWAKGTRNNEREEQREENKRRQREYQRQYRARQKAQLQNNSTPAAINQIVPSSSLAG